MVLSQRGTILLTFAAFGAVVGSHVGAMPFLVKASGVTPFIFGIVGGIGMLSSIVAMSMGGVINRHYDHRTVLLTMLPLLLAGLVFGLLVGSVASFCLSFIILSALLGTTDLFMNAEGSIVEHELRRPVFSSYHGAASLGIAAFAIIASLVSAALAPWFCAVLASVPLALAWIAVYTTIPSRPVVAKHGEKKPALLPRRVLTFVGLAAGFNVACEAAAILWAGQLLTSIAPEFAAISGLGVAFYGLCGGIMRLFGDPLRATFGDLRVMAVSIFTAVFGFAILGFAPGFWLSVLAFAGVGFGLAVTFPCLFALAGKLAPANRAAAMSYVAAVGGAPRVILPWVMGWLAAQYSLGAVFAACAFVAAGALVIIVLTFAEANIHPPAE